MPIQRSDGKYHRMTKVGGLLYNYGIDIMNDGKHKEALALANKYLRYDKCRWASGWMLKQHTLAYMWKYKEALAVGERRLQFDPEDLMALSYNSFIYSFRLKDVDNALKCCNRCIRISKKRGLFVQCINYQSKAEILFGVGRYNEAIKNYQKTLKLVINNPLSKKKKSNERYTINECIDGIKKCKKKMKEVK